MTSISSGIVGMTKKTFVTRLMMSSTMPPDVRGEHPERRREHGRDRAGGDAEQQRPPRAPDDLREDVLPWSVVPKRWCSDGCCRASSSEKSVALLAARAAVRSAPSMTMPSTTTSPTRAFGFASISRTQPGTRFFRGAARSARRRRQLDDRLASATSATVLTRGSRTRLRMSMMKFGDDRAEREDEQQRLRRAGSRCRAPPAAACSPHPGS